MSNKKLSKRQEVFIFLKKNPKAELSQVYMEFAEYSKNTVRTYYNQFFKKLQKKTTRDIPAISPIAPINIHGKLNEDVLESLIAGALSSDPTPQMIRTAVDFLVKVKGVKSADIPELDLTKFLEVTDASNSSASRN